MPVRQRGPARFQLPDGDEERRAQRLQQIFDLTPSEARLTMWVMKETPTREIATALGISIHTVRTHLRNIFVKCEVRGQGALRALVQRAT